MKMSTQLSVSSAILAAVLSGCSQQQYAGGSQQGAGGNQVAGGSQASGSQQQVESAAPVVVAQPRVVAPVRVYKPRPKATHTVKTSSIGLPPARPGQCFAKVKTPAKYITKSRRVLIQKASNKRVLVRAPQYRWINKKVLARKGFYKTHKQAAVYRNQTNRILVKPAYHKWQSKVQSKVRRIDNMTGEVLCRITVPAVYKNVTRKVQVRPARTVRKFIPAVYKTLKQKKRISQAVYKTIHRPARYKTTNYRVKVGGSRYAWRQVICKSMAGKHTPLARAKTSYKKQYRRPTASTSSGISYQQYLQVMKAPLPKKVTKKKSRKAVIKTKVTKKPVKLKKSVMKTPVKVEKAEVKKPAKMEKTKKAGKKEIKQNIVYGIQAALKSKGFNPGKLDGKMGPATAAALKSFQKSHGLPVGVLSKDTFRALGLVR